MRTETKIYKYGNAIVEIIPPTPKTPEELEKIDDEIHAAIRAILESVNNVENTKC